MNNDPSNKRLTDEENYKSSFSLQDLDTGLIIYARIISNFIKDFVEDINLSGLSQYSFIIEKGIETITNVYKTILLYSKNLELAEYHSEKASIYYIEFISQLVGSEINVRETIMFVYKKTIFDIDTERKKRVVINAEQNTYFTILDETTSFFHKFIKSVIIDTNLEDTKDILSEKIIEYSKKLNFSNDLTDNRLTKLMFLNSLMSGLSILKSTYIRTFNVLDAILKKLVKIESNDICFSMEKLTNAVDLNYSPLKTASQLLLI